MTTSRLTPTLLAALAAGSALALAGACGPGGGGNSGRAFQHASKFLVTGSHQGFTCDQCHDPAAPSYALAGGGVACLGSLRLRLAAGCPELSRMCHHGRG